MLADYRKRRVETFQARELEDARKRTSIGSLINYGLRAGCGIEAVSRHCKRLTGK